ncbi:MAG: efflux RND transporter permease subunit [Sediminibacterium sp. Gen4]|jgi:multidrug efflux pump subunit AcrB|uniref:efflux RND transporter permease subunit n=1 Tax=unclassified Sediminibacterium TaxID=2635961 RepID=UPI0015BED3FC|nr:MULTISPECIES: efflux RND transporter permease subunit [unclassified Sediminibacterium]MBW0160830.1 efflux RND transporter permease subunit [Sediminibacterium sp.]MBW0164360.1 efflux RND transporter permease subunit [Sediminibacterium sp.]NWK65233.1 efflux RND transporter permease subunit [Sediminibacterium sp. Gen4]
MSALENIKGKFKEFVLTTWSIKNKTSIYLMMLFVSLAGIYQFITLPKEQFPDIVIPTIYVQTVYVGNSPKDIENLVTRPIEKQIKGITGAKIKKFTSTSQQDFSAIMVEFDTDVKTDIALQKVKDAVDKAKQDLPNDLTQEPTVLEVSFSEQPIMYVNLSGDYDLPRLKKYADDMKDKLEDLPQINRVDIVGAPEREFQINVDNYRMQSAGVTFDDITAAVQRENLDISGGLLEVGNMKRNLQLKGQLKTAFDIQQLIVRNTNGAPIYLKDIAHVIDTIKERESYARLDGKNVVTLNIIKRSGENLIETSDGVKKIVEEGKGILYPTDMKAVITGDQSIQTRTSFNELVNSIIIGFVLVLIVLMFFMGVVNAFFVALSVPLSMFVAFVFLPGADLIVGTHVTLNFIVLFALLFGLGIIVDDAIVVIENTHRIFVEGKGKLTSAFSARIAAGEVFVPVLAGTLTTLAPFFPLLFWPGIIGKFMVYLPTMLIFTLAASLVVAFIMNPIFAVDFMNHEDEHGVKEPKSAIFKKKGFWIAIVIGILLDIAGATFWGNLLLFFMILVVFNKYVLDDAIHNFQNKALPWIMSHYESLLRWALNGRRPVHLLLGTIALFFISLFIFVGSIGSGRIPITFFPKGDPNQIFVYLKLPVGTNVEYTDSVTKVLEGRVNKILGTENGKENPIVESVISNVAVGAGDPMAGDRSTRSELGRIQVSFVEFEKRHGVSTRPYLDQIRAAMKGIPGSEISVDQESGGPPTDPPINIEIASEDFDAMIKGATALKNYLDSIQVPGVEELKMDIDLKNPEITLTVDRQRALIEGVSTAQIGMEIRTALFGREVSKVKEGKEEYKIQLRNNEIQRKSLTDLLNMRISFRDMAAGGAVKNIPISALVKVEPTSTLGSVKRKNQKRLITLRSNVLTTEGFNATAVNQVLAKHIADFKGLPDGVTIKQTGEGEQQAETGAFLFSALLIALALILLILVLQFNSVSKPVIILTEIIFSVIGVFLGFSITGMEVSILMTGFGIVGLAGIVVKNGILVIEFADELRSRGMKTKEAVIQAGKTRIIPVLLTALAAILAFIPIAVGFNINFITLFSELNPRIFFGGDNVVFWKPLSWTIIFGLTFAFFMTLIIVPAMYLIAERLRRPMRRMFGGKWISFMGIPPLTIIFLLLMVAALIRNRIARKKREKRLKNVATVNQSFIGSWF